jgi:acetoacetate decarboxylase
MASERFYPIPHWTPLYPAPPLFFNGCETVNLVCRTTVDALRKVTPYPLEVSEEVEPIFYLTATRITEFHGYTDTMMFVLDVPVVYEGESAVTTVVEYFSRDWACACGRELWGYAKKVGDIDWHETDSHVHVECRREGYTLMIVDFEKGDVIPPSDGPGPLDLYLAVRPAGAGMVTSALEVVRLPMESTTIRASNEGSARLHVFDGPHDPLSVLGSYEVLSAQLNFYDLVMPLGDVVGVAQMPSGPFASLSSVEAQVE